MPILHDNLKKTGSLLSRPVLALLLFVAATGALQADEMVGQITSMDPAGHRVQIDGAWFRLPPTVLVKREMEGGREMAVSPNRLEPGQTVDFEAEGNTIRHLRLLSAGADAPPATIPPPPLD